MKCSLHQVYSDAYIKRYRPLIPLLTVLQKPRDAGRFITLAKACLTCSAYEELDRIKCPMFVIGGKQDQVVTGEASEELAEKAQCEIYMYEKLGHAAPDIKNRPSYHLEKERKETRRARKTGEKKATFQWGDEK